MSTNEAGVGDTPTPADYTALGWALVRARGKRPLGTGWEQTKPGNSLNAWDGNYGVVLGPSGLAVVEFDTDQAGDKLLELLDATLPTTPIVQSGSGRLHLYFHDDEHQHATRDGLELRTGNHFMVLPPAVHPNGKPYRWLIDPRAFDLEAVPDAVLNYFAAEPPNTLSTPVARVIQNGERNNALTSLAGAMRRKGAGEPAILAALKATRCETPMPDRELAAIARSVSRYQPTTAGLPVDVPDSGVVWRQLANIEMRSITFRDKPLLQADAFHLIAGRKGVGKGTLIAHYASRVTRGELGDHRNVVWIGSEDSNAIDIKPRIVAASGDPSRIAVVEKGWIQLPRDFGLIDDKLADLGDVGLLVIDPVGNHIAGKSSDKESDIRDAIGQLNELADRHQAMVFGVRHLTEKECKGGVLSAILGSSAWVQVPRVVIAAVKDDEDAQVTHVQCVAGNRLPPGAAGRMFRIEGAQVVGLESEVTRAVPIGDSLKDVATMLAKAADKEPAKSLAARDLILDILEREGDQESEDFDARVARETGLTAKTVRNVRGDLKNEGLVKAFPDKDEHGQILRWKIIRTAAERP